MCGQNKRGRPFKNEIETDPVWRKGERQSIELILDSMGFELARPIRTGTSPRLSVLVRRKTEQVKSRYPKGLGGDLPTYVLTFGPKAVLNLRRAVILELNRWGLLKSHTVVHEETGDKKW